LARKKLKKTIKGQVAAVGYGFVGIEFGRTQAKMTFSDRGTIARELKIKDLDKVIVTIEKVE